MEENKDCFNNGASPTAVRTEGTAGQNFQLAKLDACGGQSQAAECGQIKPSIDGVAMARFYIDGCRSVIKLQISDAKSCISIQEAPQ